MNDYKKISVIVPTFNNGSIIHESLESILSQRDCFFEVIVVDDGSTDNTSEVVKRYQNSFPNTIRYFYQENHGVSSARNLGLSKAVGEYICFLDSDDLLLTDQSFAKRVKCLEKFFDVDIVFADAEVHYGDGKIDFWLKNTDFLNFYKNNICEAKNGCYVFGANFYKRYFEFSPFPICTQSIMFRRQVVGNLAFPEDLSIGEDVYFWYSLIRNKKVGYLNIAVANYRKRFSTLTKNLDRYHNDNIKLFLYLIKQEADAGVRGLLRKHLSSSFFELSYYYRKSGRSKKAQQYAAKSILSSPFNFKYYRNFFASFIR